MNELYRQYLIEGERAGMRYALATPHKTPLGIAGTEVGHRAGSSLEFKDHREYQPGDDLRRIDWSAYARSDKLILKLYREEISPHADIVIDGSRSMALEESAKPRATLALAALLAEAAANAGYTHTAWMTQEGCRRVGNGQRRPSLWERIDFDHRGNPLESFAHLPPMFRHQGIRILLSDLLWLGSPLLMLQHLAKEAAAVIVVQVLAHADVNPPEFGNIRLVDSETDQVHEIFVDASAVERYRHALTRHQQSWHLACRQIGAIMTTIVAEELVNEWRPEALVASEILKVSGKN